MIEIENKSERCDTENFYFFGLAIKLQILDKQIFGADFVVELEMVDNSLFHILLHFFVIMLGFIKKPLDIGNSFPLHNLTPSSTFLEYLSD